MIVRKISAAVWNGDRITLIEDVARCASASGHNAAGIRRRGICANAAYADKGKRAAAEGAVSIWWSAEYETAS